MLRCSACGGRLPRGSAVRCDCGEALHDGCRGYHAAEACDDSPDRWIGVQEF